LSNESTEFWIYNIRYFSWMMHPDIAGSSW
jgi:hypothetical protein